MNWYLVVQRMREDPRSMRALGRLGDEVLSKNDLRIGLAFPQSSVLFCLSGQVKDSFQLTLEEGRDI